MTALLFPPQELLGLFELDGAGKVLYYRMDSAGTSPELTGHNFYDEVAPFENVDEFWQCVTDCDHVNRNDTKSVLVHIRRAVNKSLRPRNTEVNTNERDVDQ